MYFIIFAKVVIVVSVLIVGIYWFMKRLTEIRVRRVDAEYGGYEKLIKSKKNNLNKYLKRYLFSNRYITNSFTMVYLKHNK